MFYAPEIQSMGAFNGIEVVQMLNQGLEPGDFAAAAGFGAGFLIARVLEGPLVGVMDIGGSLQTGVGIGIPATMLAMGIRAPLESFPLALITGAIIGLAIGLIVIGIRKFMPDGLSAGVAISIAAVISQGNMDKVTKIPFLENENNNIIIQKGHSINFGAPVEQMIRLGGGNTLEVGEINKVGIHNIEENINKDTKALLYIKSHHCVQKGMVALEDMLAIGEKYNIPLIIDAAAEEDLEKYLKMGVDLVIYSGGKAIGGPTSGFIAGKKELINYCKMQYEGIGRAMKVSKENIMGLIKAVEIYTTESQEKKSIEDKVRMENMLEEVNKIEGLSSSIEQDEAGRQIYRLKIKVDKSSFGMDAKELVRILENGDPSIYTRNHYANIGLIYIDPRPLKENYEDIIVKRLKEVKEMGR